MSVASFALPLLAPENREYWTAGESGTLRLPRCATCDWFQHPSVNTCPGCGGTMAYQDVAGTGTVVGFTINSQRWSAQGPAEFTIVLVLLDAAPNVRLTANLVDADEVQPAVGLRVEVRFQHVDDVWIPVFTPSGEGVRPVEITDPPVVIRPMASTAKFEDKVAITGIGISEVGRRLMRHPTSLAAEAARRAVADAGLTMADIDGVSTYPGGTEYRGMSEGGIPAIEETLGIRPTWFNGGMDIPGQGGAVVAAMLAVAAGLCRHVLCLRTVWEATAAEQTRNGLVQQNSGGRISGAAQYLIPYGAVSASHWIGVNASHYMHKYGATREMLGRIAVNARTNAMLNPTAVYRQPMTMDDYFNARMVTSPFGLYDCDVPSDGSVAIIVSAVETAQDAPQPAVFVEAVGTQIAERQSWDQGTLTHEPNIAGPGAHLWTRTSMTQADIDLALLYDGFTFNCVSWIEALGFCGPGEASDFIGDGTRISRAGELPVNPHGGQLSAGRTHGFGFIHEAITQLRGQAGERQISNVKAAVVSTGGGTPGGAFLFRAS